VGVVRFRAGETSAYGSPAIPVLPAVAAAPARVSSDSLESAVGDIADHNLFRPERTSAEEREMQLAAAATMAMPSPSTKPRLVLRGVLGGPPWDAVVEGIPGRDGAVVVRAGESVSGITIRSVRRDTAYARGFDTTWALTLGRSW
jgi:hypothetical protein